MQEYRAELKERTGFILSLGGAAIALCFYNMAVYQQIEIETYRHVAQLLNQDQIMSGIINFKNYIDIFMWFIPLYLALHTLFSPQDTSVKVIGTKRLTLWIYPFAVSLFSIALIIGTWISFPIWGNRESNFGAIAGVWVFVATNIICLISLFIRKENVSGDKVKYDVKVMTPVVSSFVLLACVSMSYMFSIVTIQNETKINFVENDNKAYYVVEKDKDKILLREIEKPDEKNKEESNLCKNLDNCYLPTQRYEVVSATDVVITNKEMIEPIGKKLTKIEFEEGLSGRGE
ncbi:hypothetical protein [Exiguobacterium antarcticum]|uniref:hypothetical protein n=1 Tax=Exiguobacterium antarcticum TaxID=132920 RepID=UPI00249C5EC8|nr:hypothetical protein [Exiguobacterium antarcticum]